MTAGCGGTLGGPGGSTGGGRGGNGGGGGSNGRLLCRSNPVSVFLTKDRGSCCGSSVKDQGRKGSSGLERSQDVRRMRFFGGCLVGLCWRGRLSSTRTPESSEWVGPEQESSSSPPDTKPASRSMMRSVTKKTKR